MPGRAARTSRRPAGEKVTWSASVLVACVRAPIVLSAGESDESGESGESGESEGPEPDEPDVLNEADDPGDPGEGCVPNRPGRAMAMIRAWPGRRATRRRTPSSPSSAYSATRVTRPVHGSSRYGTPSRSVRASVTSWSIGATGGFTFSWCLPLHR